MALRIGSTTTIDGVRGEVVAIHANGRVKLRTASGDFRLVVADEAALRQETDTRRASLAETWARRKGGKVFVVLSMLTGETIYAGASEHRTAVESELGTCYGFGRTHGEALAHAVSIRDRVRQLTQGAK